MHPAPEDVMPCHEAPPVAPAHEGHADALSSPGEDCCSQEIQQGDEALPVSLAELPVLKAAVTLSLMVSPAPLPTSPPRDLPEHDHPPHAPPLGLHLLHGVLLT